MRELAGPGLRASMGQLLFLGAVWSALWWRIVFLGEVLYTRDIPVFTLPSKRYLWERLLDGEIPLWWPDAGLGLPFLADPTHQALYPLNLVGLMFPDPVVGTTWFLVIHSLLAMLAGRRLAGVLGAAPWTATIAGGVWGVIGYNASIIDNLIYAPATVWIPWTLAAVLGTAQGTVAWGRGVAWAGLGLGMLTLAGDVQGLATTIAASGLLVSLRPLGKTMARLSWRSAEDRQGESSPGRAPGSGTAADSTRSASRPEPDGSSGPVFCGELHTAPGGPDMPVGARTLLLAIVLALLIGAIQIGPTLGLLGLSVRGGGLPYAEVSAYSLPPARSAELLIPFALGTRYPRLEGPRAGMYPVFGATFVESIYLSVPLVTLALAALGGFRRSGSLPWGWLLIGAVSWMLAIGRHGPLLPLLYESLPLAGLVRYPEKYVQWLSLAAWALAVLAASAWVSGARPGVTRGGSQSEFGGKHAPVSAVRRWRFRMPRAGDSPVSRTAPARASPDGAYGEDVPSGSTVATPRVMVPIWSPAAARARLLAAALAAITFSALALLLAVDSWPELLLGRPSTYWFDRLGAPVSTHDALPAFAGATALAVLLSCLVLPARRAPVAMLLLALVELTWVHAGHLPSAPAGLLKSPPKEVLDALQGLRRVHYDHVPLRAPAIRSVRDLPPSVRAALSSQSRAAERADGGKETLPLDAPHRVAAALARARAAPAAGTEAGLVYLNGQISALQPAHQRELETRALQAQPLGVLRLFGVEAVLTSISPHNPLWDLQYPGLSPNRLPKGIGPAAGGFDEVARMPALNVRILRVPRPLPWAYVAERAFTQTNHALARVFQSAGVPPGPGCSRSAVGDAGRKVAGRHHDLTPTLAGAGDRTARDRRAGCARSWVGEVVVAGLDPPQGDGHEVGPVPSISAIARPSPERIELAIRGGSRAGVLVVNESWLPGWRAWVDGREVPVGTANGRSLAVTVARDARQVVLRYRPPGWVWYGAATVAGFLLCAALLAPGLTGQRTARGASPDRFRGRMLPDWRRTPD